MIPITGQHLRLKIHYNQHIHNFHNLNRIKDSFYASYIRELKNNLTLYTTNYSIINHVMFYWTSKTVNYIEPKPI